jgi:nicotinate-nucleotide--dimethylbenzimidazole phosphoribosyltransferase
MDNSKRPSEELEQELSKLIQAIAPVDRGLEPEVNAHLDSLTKPKGSLGRLEEFARRICLITGSLMPEIPRKCVLVFAGDHGVTEEGISAFPREVTYQMVKNFLAGGAGINVLARHVGAEVKVIDIGVDHDLSHIPELLHLKVAPGTSNMARGPAMTKGQALASVLNGASAAAAAMDEGFAMLATGEMGIGNTTPASAVTAAICGKSPEQVTGRGTGIDSDAFSRKIEVIEQALRVNRPDPSDPMDVLQKVGGFEIGGIAGMILMAASRRVPVVVDGFISTAGALIAAGLAPHVKDYLFAGHKSVEQGHRVQMEYLGLRPVLDLDMRLGEGTGAALTMGLIDAGLKIYREMATFQDASVAPGNEAI